MARAPSTFRQNDVTRAVKATKAAGVDIARIEIAKDGRIVIITTAETVPHDEAADPLDQWLVKHAHRAEGH